jgi:hypothetical protein
VHALPGERAQHERVERPLEYFHLGVGHGDTIQRVACYIKC